MWYTSSCGRIKLQMTRAQALSASHPGPCDADVATLSRVPTIQRQLDRINPDILRAELRGYGAWSPEELADHPQNLQRILWLAAGDIADR